MTQAVKLGGRKPRKTEQLGKLYADTMSQDVRFQVKPYSKQDGAIGIALGASRRGVAASTRLVTCH